VKFLSTYIKIKDWEFEKETKVYSQFLLVKHSEITLFFYLHIT
jgi:hypothetical protein